MSFEEKKYTYITENKEAEKAIDYLSNFSRLGYDVESTGLQVIRNQDKLLLIQLGTEEHAFLFDPRKMDGHLLAPILEDPKILKVGHNLKYDYQAIKEELNIKVDNMFDTMLAYRLLTSGLVENGNGGFIPLGLGNKNKKQFPYKSLKFLTQKYLGISLDKSVRNSFSDNQYNREFTEEQLSYAADDVLVVHPLCDILSEMLQKEGLIETALLEFEFLRACSEMELNGVCIDKEHWRRIISEATEQKNIIGVKIANLLEPFQEQNTLYGTSLVNISSKDQILGAFSKMGFNLENTEEKTLKQINHPLSKLLLQWRGYDKLISTYGEAILSKINRNTDRLHFTLMQLGTQTGRLSSEKPNIQNIPQDKENDEVSLSFRECFIAPEGSKILTADYSQCIPEDAWIAVEEGLTRFKNFEDNLDYQVPSMSNMDPQTKSCGVDAYIPKGRKAVVRLETEDGFELICTPDHRVRIGNPEENWKEASEVELENDYLTLSRGWIKDLDTSIQSELFAEMLGFWIGDGSFSGGGIQFAKGENKYADVFDRLNYIAQQCFDKELKNYKNSFSWDLCGKYIQKEFERWGCVRSQAAEKQVPQKVLSSGRTIISSFLRGLFEADGWVIAEDKNNIIAFSTRSEELSKQVQLLLLGIGIFSKRKGYYEETEINGHHYEGIQYRVSICDEYNQRLFTDRIGFISNLKSSKLVELRQDRVRSHSDYLVFSETDYSRLREWSQKESGARWPVVRRKFYANYYNDSTGLVRYMSRSKLNNLLEELGMQSDHLEIMFGHNKAYSKIVSRSDRGVTNVADISVPKQKAFVAYGAFVHNCELRLLAEISQDKKFIEIFQQGGDLHMITAQDVFGFSNADKEIYDKVKKKDLPGTDLSKSFSAEEVSIYKNLYSLRSKTKAINFGIAYGLSAWSLSDSFKIPLAEAEDILDGYFSTYYGIKRWLDKNAHETLALRYSKTILGRKRYFTLADPQDEQMFRRSKNAVKRAGNNAVIQGGNADITKKALSLLQREYDKIEGAKLLFTVHDEIVSEVKDSAVEEVSKLKAKLMADAFHYFVKTVPVGKDDKVEVIVADHWTK